MNEPKPLPSETKREGKMSQIPKMPENWDAYNDRPAIPDKDKTEPTKKLVERLREVAGGADTEFGEDSKLMLEAATALASLADELRLAREALKQAAEMLQASLPYWQTDERGNGPDCTPLLQAILNANAALKKPR